MRPSNLDNWIMETEALPQLTREGLDALQLKKLNGVLQRVTDRGGAYREYPRELSSLEELQSLPFTTASMLAQNPGSFLTTSQSEVSRVISGMTSGTTGSAKRVFYTEKDLEHTIGFYAAGIGEMLRPGEKCLIAFPFSGPFGLGDLIARAVERLGGIPIRCGIGQTWEMLNGCIRDAQPQCYIGFPVTLLSALRLYGAGFPIRKALVSGDACPPGVMQALETALGNPLYPHYGSRESGLGGAITCPAFAGMHLRENHILAEIVDEAGNVLPEGEYGELVLTTIGLEAMPLLRYRTGDYTRFLPPCPCGSPTRRLDLVRRREGPLSIQDMDSALFSLPDLIDYRASFDGTLHLALRTLGDDPTGAVRQSLASLYPGIRVSLSWQACQVHSRPLYPGKRYVDKCLSDREK